MASRLLGAGLLVPLLLGAGLLPGRAQTADAPLRESPAAAAPASPEDPVKQLRTAYKLLEDDQAGAAMALLLPARDALENAGDLDRLGILYSLTGYAGKALGDRPTELSAKVQAVLLAYLANPLESIDTLDAEFSLAEAYSRHDVRDAQLLVLANMLASVEAARRAGPLPDALEETETIALLLMGQRLRADGRPELALAVFRRALPLAQKGRVDAENAGKLAAIVAEMEAAAAPLAPPPEAGACLGRADLPAARMAECRQAADRALAAGDAATAERLLVELLADVPQGSLREERFEAARDLLLLRQMNRPADDADLAASVDLVGNYLASIGEVAGAAIAGARVVRSALDRGVYEPRLAEMCGHLARRAVRVGAPQLALRLLAFQRAVVMAGLGEGVALERSIPNPEVKRRLVAALLQLEIAHTAAAAGYADRAAAERAEVDRQVASLDLADFDRIEDMTAISYAGVKDYVFPSYMAAIDLMGRLASRLPPGDPRRDSFRIGWVSGLASMWGEPARADALADEAIREIRAAPEGRRKALSTLLTLRAETVIDANPALSARFTREAYEVIAVEPGHETERIALLLDMASDQSDAGLAAALVDEAQRLRAGASGIEPRILARLDLKRSYRAFDAGDTALAIRLAEDAIATLVAANGKDDWSVLEPARSLAAVYAAAGRLDEARATYEAYVFPQSEAVLVGEEKALDDQLGLANLEAYYAPRAETLRTLATLLDRSRRRLKADSDVPRRIRRAQAFAYYGLGDGIPAREAARAALEIQRPPASDTASAREDRKLLETLVGADWAASRAAATP
ncbi:hypothetical protein [Ancylobacter terrae]|uniref:hypothetical protein n=1 Tax=Ancylobacter sp. sgz301288 TaxID=3342077 RepID=UPI00385E3F65